jgi:hypothetical protein
MPSRRDCFPGEFTPLSVASTRIPIRQKIAAHPLDDWCPIDGMWMMTAQDRKDFRRVQKSRDIWKKRAVRRGEDRRRLGQRRQEVDRSRSGWRERALEAEHRTRQLEIENHQLKRALRRTPAFPTIDNTHFF